MNQDQMTTGVNTWTVNAGLLITRLMLGVVFVFHGSQKLFGWFGGYGLSGTAGFMEQIGMPLPSVSAFMAGSTEFFGGLLLMAGVATRLAAVPMAFTMFVAAFVVHGGTFSVQAGGMEYPLTLGLLMVSLVLSGGGDWNVARLLGRRSGAGVPSVDVVTS
ncbi:MAG: DoxX family protein [Phycisphaerae bacterium]